VSSPPALEGVIRQTSLCIIARTTWRGRAAVVVMGAPGVERDEVAPALEALAAAHRRARHPHLAPVGEDASRAATPWVVFDCPAVCDTATLLARLSEGFERIPYQAADAHIVSLRDALRAGHAAAPPAFLGRICPHNVLHDARGGWWLLGLGRNVPLEERGGRFDPLAQVFQAPELVGLAAPAAITDFVALILFMRSVLAYVDLPNPLARLLRGEFEPGDEVLAGLVLEFEQRVMSALPGQRATIDEAIDVSNRIRAALGVQLDEGRFRALAQRLLSGVGTPVATLRADAAELEGQAGRVRLGRAQRRLLLALQEATTHGTSLDIEACVAAGWPGQRLIFESGRNRVYAVIRQLRSAGVPIERFDGGYRLSAPLGRG
jgi:hypothetical protein